MIEFPRFVYRDGGGVWQRKGGTFHFTTVRNMDEYNAHLADGWFDSVQDLIDGATPAVSAPVVTEDAPVVKRRGRRKATE